MIVPAARAQFTFSTNQGTLAIIGYTGPGGNVTIPAATNGLPITSISDNAFQGATFGSVRIPASVTNIGQAAFFNTGVTNVTIPNGVKIIGAVAFAFCGMSSVTIPASVTNLGQNVFIGDYRLRAITVAAGNMHYSSAGGVLFDLRRTELIEYPGGLAGNYSVPSGVTNIGYQAFWSCGSLTGVTIPGSVITIAPGAFQGCGLTNLALANGVKSIELQAFLSCVNLTNVTIPATVTYLGTDAFENCSNLTVVYFKGNAPAADATVFLNTGNGALAYYLPATTGWTSSVGGIPAALEPTIVIRTAALPATANGVVTGASTYALGSNATVTASTTNDCYYFTRWTVENRAVSTVNPYTFTVTNNETLTANFAMLEYTISTGSYPTNGGTTSGGGTISCGGTATLKAVPDAGFVFTNWTVMGQPDIIITNNPYSIRDASTSETLVAHFRDSQAPTVTIASPTPNQRWSNSIFTAMGMARDNVLVSNVFCQLNGGGWTLATPSNSAGSNWTGALAPLQETNLFEAYAVDSSGNKSPTKQVTFLYVPSAMLTVQTNGLGGITPVDNGKLLAIGTNYTLTAAPGHGWIFSNWIGGTSPPYTAVRSTSPSYTFVMQSNLVLEANFIPNPFSAVAGTYHGLFYNTDAVVPSSAGSFSAQVASNGSFTATLQQGNSGHPVSGQFSVFGNWTTNGLRTWSNTAVSLTLDMSGSGFISGGLTNSAWAAELVAERAAFSRTNSSPQAGRYTLFIPGNDSETNGDGVGTVSVDTSGNVTFNGTLGDGTGISQTSTISMDGRWPFYASLFTNNGVILGWLTFTNEPPTNGLVAYYPFSDGNLLVSDASGNGNGGAISGSNWVYGLDRFGRTNGLYLNTNAPANASSGDHIVVQHALLDFSTDFTLSIWINIPDGLPSYHVHNLISGGQDTINANFRVISAVDNTNDYLQFVGGLSLGQAVDLHAMLPPLRNTWWQAVVVRSGTNLALFQNGALVATTNSTAVLQPSPFGGIWIGGMPINEVPGSGQYPLDGGIDDIRLYSRALSSTEVGQLYAFECGPRLNAVGRDISGTVSWIKLPQPLGHLFQAGVTNITAAIGSQYMFTSEYAFTNGTVPVLSFTNGEVWLAGGNLAGPFTNSILLRTNRVMNLGLLSGTNGTPYFISNQLNLNIIGPTGVFAGNVIDPLTGKTNAINGVVLQNQNLGTGFFLGTNQSGRVYFGPR